MWPRLLAWLTSLTFLFLCAYYALTGYLAYSDLQAARAELVEARDIAARSPGNAQLAVENATASARAATVRLNGPLWTALAAIPVLGDSPAAARELTGAFAEAMDGLEPLVADMGLLLARALVQDGSLETNLVDVAAPAAQEALPAIQSARERLQRIPPDGAVLPQIRRANTELQEQLSLVEQVLITVAQR